MYFSENKIMKTNLKFLSKLKGLFSFEVDKQYIFLVVAAVLLIVVVALVVWGLGFLISNFTEALTEPVSSMPLLQFDIEGFERLNLVR